MSSGHRGCPSVPIITAAETRDPTLLGRSVIHAVSNPLSQFTGAMHTYGDDFFAVPRSTFDPGTLEETVSTLGSVPPSSDE